MQKEGWRRSPSNFNPVERWTRECVQYKGYRVHSIYRCPNVLSGQTSDQLSWPKVNLQSTGQRSRRRDGGSADWHPDKIAINSPVATATSTVRSARRASARLSALSNSKLGILMSTYGVRQRTSAKKRAIALQASSGKPSSSAPCFLTWGLPVNATISVQCPTDHSANAKQCTGRPAQAAHQRFSAHRRRRLKGFK